MQKLIRGTIASLVILGLTACVSDPFAAINGDYKTVATNPQIMYISKPGDSSAVLVRLVNDANNGGVSSYTVSGVGAGIVVHYDATYRPEYLNGSDTLIVPEDKNQQRYWVVGMTPGEWSFTLTSTVNSSAASTVKVRVEYTNLGAALSTNTAAPGDEITINAPPFSHFTQTASISFPTGGYAISERDPDGKFIKFLAGPGITGAVTVSQVVMDYYPSVGNLSLTSTNTLTSSALTVAPTTVGSATPNIGQGVTVQLGAQLRFLGNSHVFVGGVEAGIQSVSADSSTATIVPFRGSAGNVTYTNVALKFLTGVALNLPGDKTITVSSTYSGGSDANASSPGTATTISLPAAGRSYMLTDAGAFTAAAPCTLSGFFGASCRFYKVVLPSARALTFTLNWTQGTSADMGVYTLNGAQTTAQFIADNFGDQNGGTETGTTASLAAGTWYIVVVTFDVTPSFYQVLIQ